MHACGIETLIANFARQSHKLFKNKLLHCHLLELISVLQLWLWKTWFNSCLTTSCPLRAKVWAMSFYTFYVFTFKFCSDSGGDLDKILAERDQTSSPEDVRWAYVLKGLGLLKDLHGGLASASLTNNKHQKCVSQTVRAVLVLGAEGARGRARCD